ncbi:hypothetical protein, partial [Mesorhizobium sp.]|uniref:hypothetical protein n=1 Tax=Mesorhizobium sp. TaxID=1871066 RepID=UPI003F90D3DF
MPLSRSTPRSSNSLSVKDFVFSQLVVGPLRYLLSRRFDTIPSRPGRVDQMIDRVGFARHRLAELDATFGPYEAGQDFPPVLQRHVAQVVAVEMQQIERDEIEVVLAPGDCLAQRGKIRKASIIQDDNFAVDDGVLYVETFGCLD